MSDAGTERSDDIEDWFERRTDVLLDYISRYGGEDSTHIEARLSGYLDGLREGKQLVDGDLPPVDDPPYADLLPEGVTADHWSCSHCGEQQMSIEKPSHSHCPWCGNLTEWALADEAGDRDE